MKKILLTLTFVFTAFLSFAQPKAQFSSYKNILGIYDYTKREYKFDEPSYAHLTIKIYDDYVSINDNASSIYRFEEIIPKRITPSYQVSSVKCLDEKNVSCIFGIMTHGDNSHSISIIYDGYMIIYYLDEK